MPTALVNRSATHSILAALRPETVESGLDGSSTEGLEDLPYAIEHQSIEHHLKRTHVPVWFWRSVGHSQNALARECFFDELAAAAGTDPVEYRRRLLNGKRDLLKVLETAAARRGLGPRSREARLRASPSPRASAASAHRLPMSPSPAPARCAWSALSRPSTAATQ